MMKKTVPSKLRTKMILTTVTVCILALLLQGGILLYLSTRTFSSRAYEDLSYFLESNHALLNNKMMFVERIILNLRNDPSMQAFFTGSSDREQIAGQYAFCADLSSEQNLVDSYVPFATEVHAFNASGDLLSEYYDITSIPAGERRKAELNARALYASYKDSHSTVSCSVDSDSLYFIVKLYSPQLTELGLCVVRVDLQTLEMILRETGSYQNSFWTLLDADGRQVITCGKTLSSEDAGLLWQDRQYYMHTVAIESVPYQVVPYNLSFGLKSVAAVPSSQIYANLRIMTTSTIITLLALIPLTMAVAFFSSWKVTEPLKTVAYKISLFGKGDLDTRLGYFGIQEFDDIVSVFNEMTERIHTLITQVYENQLLATKAQIKYLQSQINPHFLYNVLTTIALRARLDGNENVYRMVYSLSCLLQGKLFRSGEIKIRLRQELELVEFYLYLQNMRYPDRLSYGIDCPEGLLDLFVPRMCIEPVVENAVTHGLEPKEGEGAVKIRIYEAGSVLCIEVCDDGVGFSTERIPSDSHTHVGLKNIEQLIRNLYGGDFGMSVESRPGEGTKVLLRLPVERSADHEKGNDS